jgi:hypothetical protein
MIEQMEAQAILQLAASTERKASACISSSHRGDVVEVRTRRLKSGKQIFGYSFCSVRLERVVLLQLLCPEAACPHCKRTQAQWRAFRGQVPPAAPNTLKSVQFRHLVEEVTIEEDGRNCIARPAAFQCLSACPVNAHPPMVIRKSGWDVFANGRCIAGGLTTNPDTGMSEPIFPTIEAVRNWTKNQSIQGSVKWNK